jgi:creatinine amidohydrolase/Fe(II)-dependent formamide hydrolase-like protein
MLESLGFDRDAYIVGMDFPNNALPSAYCPEEIFALAVREVLREVRAIGARYAVLVNGHGAVNHLAVLNRLATEINHTTDLRVIFGRGKPAPKAPKALKAAPSSGGHADEGETSLMMHLYGETVDLGQLPPADQPIRYSDYAIVDGPGFDGTGPADHVLQNDPRTKSSAQKGRAAFDVAVKRLVERVASAMAEA